MASGFGSVSRTPFTGRAEGSGDDDADPDDAGGDDEGSAAERDAAMEAELKALREQAEKLENDKKQLLSEKSKYEAAQRELAAQRGGDPRAAAVVAGIEEIRRNPTDPRNAVLQALGSEIDSLSTRLEKAEQRNAARDKIPADYTERVEQLVGEGRFAKYEDAYKFLVGEDALAGKLPQPKPKPEGAEGDTVTEEPPVAKTPRPVQTAVRGQTGVSRQLSEISRVQYRQQLEAATADIYGESGSMAGGQTGRKLVREVRGRRVRVAGE